MESNSKKFMVAVVGPTAVGKTDLAILLAHHFQTEVVSADSRQVFKEISIGTAKPSAIQLAAVRHHFINVRSIYEDFDAGAYGREALAVVNQIFTTRDVVILCGGSGLYVKAVCEGFDDIPEVDAAIRQQLMNEYEERGISWLQAQLQESDPEYFAEVDVHNPHRLVRALEIIRSSGMPVTAYRKSDKLKHDFGIVKIGLDLDRDELYHRIDLRVDQMIEAGLEEEAIKLYPHKSVNALQTVGYQELFDHFDGAYDLTEAIRLIKRNTRHYAKRQLTWFRKDPATAWFDPTEWEAIIDHLSKEGVR